MLPQNCFRLPVSFPPTSRFPSSVFFTASCRFDHFRNDKFIHSNCSHEKNAVFYGLFVSNLSLLPLGIALAAINSEFLKSLNKNPRGSIMTLVRYKNRPERDLMSKNFSDIMDEFFNDVVQNNRDSFVPGIDISETDNQFQISAELPGMDKDDIEISLDNGRLSISGERKFEKEEDGKKFHRVETRYGSFNRSFQLPDNVDEESIEATYENGLLNISIDKAEDKVKKKIEIS